jgi:hypothetical protein
MSQVNGVEGTEKIATAGEHQKEGALSVILCLKDELYLIKSPNLQFCFDMPILNSGI